MSKNIVETISAGGIIYEDGKYLLINWPSENTVEIPKGTVKLGESIEDACKREILEETGYTVEIIAPLSVSNYTVDWHDGKTYHKTVHYFLLNPVKGSELHSNRQQGEDFENLWVSSKDALSLLSFEEMRTAMLKAMQICEKGKDDRAEKASH
ncbi:MAG: NUDIX domain-containing protein [Candidatus Nomurabacteria bacterium]|jgi:8-oxo-dGTP diphosphatase|nr:NUDIX domain-containing protein [Candidatus Nomurabacteria bacterium]